MKPFFCVPIIKFVSNNDNFDTSKSFLWVIQYKYSKPSFITKTKICNIYEKH